MHDIRYHQAVISFINAILVITHHLRFFRRFGCFSIFFIFLDHFLHHLVVFCDDQCRCHAFMKLQTVLSIASLEKVSDNSQLTAMMFNLIKSN